MYEDEYNDAELDVIQHVAEDIDNLENGRPPRRRAYVSRGEGNRLDVNISVKYTNQKLDRLPIPIILKTCRTLNRIDLSGIDLGTNGLPPQLEKCGELYYLKLEHCNLAKLPAVICRLQSLVVLDIRHNQLDRIPPELQDLKHLRALSLSYNQFRELPTFLTRVGVLKTIEVAGNPLEVPPRDVWDPTMPQNRGLEGLEMTKQILNWFKKQRPQASSSADTTNTDPNRPDSLLPRPLNLSKPQTSLLAPGHTPAMAGVKVPNRSGSMDTTVSEAATDNTETAISANHASYVTRKIGKAYYKLVQHIRAQLLVGDASSSGPNIGPEFVNLLHALAECAKDLMTVDAQEGSMEKAKVLVYCGSQLLSDVLRSFLEDVAMTADDDLLEDFPLLLEMVDRSIVSALHEIGVHFTSSNSMDVVSSLFGIAGHGMINFSYSGQIVPVRVPELRAAYAPAETPDSSLSYANSAMSSTTDLQQMPRLEDEPYELVGEVIGNCAYIVQELNNLLVAGFLQSAAPHINKLWTDTILAVQHLDQRANILHVQLTNFSANEIATLRGPFEALSSAVILLSRHLNKFAKQSNLVSAQTTAAFKRIKEAAATAMRLLNGAGNSAITPRSAAAITSAGSAGSYAPARPLNAALGPAAARMVGGKDTSSLFKKIDNLNRKGRRF